MLYLIGAEDMGPLKIGVSGNVPSRLAALQSGCPVPLNVYATGRLSKEVDSFIREYCDLREFNNHENKFKAIDKMKRDLYNKEEATLHRELKRFRLHGEWFSLSLLDIIFHTVDVNRKVNHTVSHYRGVTIVKKEKIKFSGEIVNWEFV